MSLIEINWHPTKKELRKFGLIALVFLGVIACLSRFVFSAPMLASIIIALFGLLIFIVSLLSAKLTRLIYLGLTFAGLPIGLTVSVTLMAIFYFLILTPVGLFFKLIGRDILQRKFQPGSQTYWSKNNQIMNLNVISTNFDVIASAAKQSLLNIEFLFIVICLAFRIWFLVFI